MWEFFSNGSFWNGGYTQGSGGTTPNNGSGAATSAPETKKTYGDWSAIINDLLSKGMQLAQIIAQMKNQGYNGEANFQSPEQLQAYLMAQAKAEQEAMTTKIVFGVLLLLVLGGIVYAIKK